MSDGEKETPRREEPGRQKQGKELLDNNTKIPQEPAGHNDGLTLGFAIEALLATEQLRQSLPQPTPLFVWEAIYALSEAEHDGP
jgi:hypothetical protein